MKIAYRTNVVARVRFPKQSPILCDVSYHKKRLPRRLKAKAAARKDINF
jgi:hypothetical protein